MKHFSDSLLVFVLILFTVTPISNTVSQVFDLEYSVFTIIEEEIEEVETVDDSGEDQFFEVNPIPIALLFQGDKGSNYFLKYNKCSMYDQVILLQPPLV